MSNEIAIRQKDGMVPIDDPEFQKLVRFTYCRDANEAEWRLFVEQCRTLNLNPVSKQITQVRMQGNLQTIVMIDGYRSVAQRTGQFAGRRGPYWCGKDGVWKDVWLSEEFPFAAKVEVFKKGCEHPITGIARWKSFAAYGRKGLMPTWSKMPDVMLAKCAEAQALRAAFPIDLGGIYVKEELDAETSKPQVVKEDISELPEIQSEVATWQPTPELKNELISILEKAGIRFNAENKKFFIEAKERAIGKPLDDWKNVVLAYIDELAGA